MFVVYILKSIATGKYYIGQTQNLTERLTRHNTCRSAFTKKDRPWKIVYQESFVTRAQAMQREKQIKAYKGGEAFKKLLP